MLIPLFVALSILGILSLIGLGVTLTWGHDCSPKGFFKAYLWYAQKLVEAFFLKQEDTDPFNPKEKMLEGVFFYKLGLLGFGLLPFVVMAGIIFLIPLLLTTPFGLGILIAIGTTIGLVFLSYFTLKIICKVGVGAERVTKVIEAVNESSTE